MSLRARELGLSVGHSSFLFHLPDTAVLWILKSLPSHWGWSPYFGTQLGPPRRSDHAYLPLLGFLPLYNF